MASQKQRLKDLITSFNGLVTNPKIAGTVDEFYGRKETHSGLWLSAEEGNIIDVGFSAFDYYSYPGGIHEKAQTWADNNNVLLEFNDPGTIMLYLQ